MFYHLRRDLPHQKSKNMKEKTNKWKFEGKRPSSPEVKTLTGENVHKHAYLFSILLTLLFISRLDMQLSHLRTAMVKTTTTVAIS